MTAAKIMSGRMMSPETGVGADTVGGGGGDIVRRGEGDRAGTTSVGSATKKWRKEAGSG